VILISKIIHSKEMDEKTATQIDKLKFLVEKNSQRSDFSKMAEDESREAVLQLLLKFNEIQNHMMVLDNYLN
jgi:hypothetical protein